MLKKKIILLITILSAVNLFNTNLLAGISYKDYFPLEVGNEWHYETVWQNWGNGPDVKITDTLSLKDKKYYIFESTDVSLNDTLRIDDLGRVWKFRNNNEQIWLDFSTDSTYYYYENYPEYNYTDTFEVTPKKYTQFIFNYVTYDSCISFWFDNPNGFDEEREYLFLPSIGLAHIYYNTPMTGAYRNLYYAIVKNKFFGHSRKFYPSIDTLYINFDFPPPKILTKTNNYNNHIDEIELSSGEYYKTYFTSNAIYFSFSPIDTCKFLIYDSLDTYNYELWYEPLQPYSEWDTLSYQLPLDTICFIDGYPYMSGTCNFVLKILENSVCIDSITQPVKIFRVGMAVDDNLQSSTFLLSQNYPNPFNPTTSITYTLPQKSNVKISIYDLSGRWIETLVNNEIHQGTHQVIWNASRYSSGVYFYKIEAGDFVDFRKCLLVK